MLLSLPVSGVLAQTGTEEAEAVVEMRDKLASYAGSDAVVIRVERALAALESADYGKRRTAMKTLIEATGCQAMISQALAEARTAEKRTALRIVLAAQTEDNAEEKLRLLMRRIQVEKLRGLAGAILDAWEGRVVSHPETARLSRQAIGATVEAGDRERLLAALKCTTALVRELAVWGLRVALPEEEWAEVVHPLLNDESEAVRLQVAIMLCAQGDRRVLPVLAELLESETFVIRHESHEILVAVTDQDFGYFSDGQPERRAAAMGLWRRWVAKFEDKAEMRFDQVRPWLEDGRPRDE